MSEQTSEWISVTDAARVFRMPARTLYAYVERQQLSAKKIRGVCHVKRGDVGRVASSRSGDTRRAQPEPESVATARERVMLKNLEGEELRAAVGVQRTRDEITSSEAERAKRRELLTIETARARLALEKDRAEHARQLAEEEDRRRAAEHQRAIELERERERHERQQVAESAAKARAAWEKRWLGWALGWLREHVGGTEPSYEAIVIVRDALKRHSPNDIDALVEIHLNAALRAGLSEHVAAWRRHLAEEARATLIVEAAKIAVRERRETHDRVLRAARAAAAAIDPESATMRQHVLDAARAEHDRILAEEREARERESEARRIANERDRQARLQTEEAERRERREAEERRKEESRKSDWRWEKGQIFMYVVDMLPREATGDERVEGRSILEALHAEMCATGNASVFRTAARRALDELDRRIRVRLRAQYGTTRY